MDIVSLDAEHIILDFLRCIEDTRNYFIHYSKWLESRALVNDELFDACAKCWAILTYCLAKRIFNPLKTHPCSSLVFLP